MQGEQKPGTAEQMRQTLEAVLSNAQISINKVGETIRALPPELLTSETLRDVRSALEAFGDSGCGNSGCNGGCGLTETQ